MIWKEKLSAIFRNGTQRRPPGIFGRWFFYRVFTEFLCSVVLVGLRGTFFWSGFFFFGGGGGVSSPASRNPKRRCRVTRTSERIHAGHPRIPFVRHPTCRVLFVFVFFLPSFTGFPFTAIGARSGAGCSDGRDVRESMPGIRASAASIRNWRLFRLYRVFTGLSFSS